MGKARLCGDLQRHPYGENKMITGLLILIIAIAIWSFVVGHKDGKEKFRDLYLDEQNKRVFLENQLKNLKHDYQVLSQKLTAR